MLFLWVYMQKDVINSKDIFNEKSVSLASSSPTFFLGKNIILYFALNQNNNWTWSI